MAANTCLPCKNACVPARAPIPTIASDDPPGPRLDDWNLLRSFLLIYETGTLTEAARRAGSTQPSMGRHLRELEERLGETLFVRLPGKLKPTPRADVLHAATRPMHLAVREAQRLFTGDKEQVVGVVRVAVAEAYAYHVVPQILAPLLHDHPELEIELSVSNRADNLLRRDADIAIRFFRPQQNDVVALKVGETEMGLFVREDYLERFGEPQDVVVPPRAVVAGFDREPMPLERALQGEAPPQPLRFRMRSDSALAREAAVESGFCMGMFFVDIAQQRPWLRRVLPNRVRLPQEVWLCAHDEVRRSNRMRLVWDCLASALEERFRASSGAWAP